MEYILTEEEINYMVQILGEVPGKWSQPLLNLLGNVVKKAQDAEKKKNEKKEPKK